MLRYIHGSEDSTDLDVVYICDRLPDRAECLRFCAEDPRENRNLAEVRDGIVTVCYKGLPDEVNDALLATYPLHEQQHALIITRHVPRNVMLKALTVLRKLLMVLRRTQWSREALCALKGSWQQRLELLDRVELGTLEWRKGDPVEEHKRIAFQLGQLLALIDGSELYTKRTIAGYLPELRPYLYRCGEAPEALEGAFRRFVSYLHSADITEPEPGLLLLREGTRVRRFRLDGGESEIDG